MADKSIWKKTLGLFVEFDEEKVPQLENSNDLEAILAQSQQALASLGEADIPKDKEPTKISNIVGSYVSSEDVTQVLEQQTPTTEGQKISFDDLYQAVCEQKISIFRVKEILDQPELGNLPKETKAKAAAVALRAMGSSIEEVIQDAYQKDQALDTAELVKRQKNQSQKEANEAQIGAIQKEVDEFLKLKNQQIDALRKQNLELDQELHSWVQAKLEEEKKIFDIVAHFVADHESEMTLGEVYPESNKTIASSPQAET